MLGFGVGKHRESNRPCVVSWRGGCVKVEGWPGRDCSIQGMLFVDIQLGQKDSSSGFEFPKTEKWTERGVSWRTHPRENGRWRQSPLPSTSDRRHSGGRVIGAHKTIAGPRQAPPGIRSGRCRAGGVPREERPKRKQHRRNLSSSYSAPAPGWISRTRPPDSKRPSQPIKLAAAVPSGSRPCAWWNSLTSVPIRREGGLASKSSERGGGLAQHEHGHLLGIIQVLPSTLQP